MLDNLSNQTDNMLERISHEPPANRETGSNPGLADRGDNSYFIYTWKPEADFEWENAAAIRRLPPSGSIFAVIASRNERHKAKFPEIDCYIAFWNWIEGEDPVLAEAPIEWVDRYDRKLWTRGES